MGCACKVNQQITYLQKHFGTNQPTQKSTKPSISIITTRGLVWLILIPLMPLMLLFIIFRKIFKKKPIEIGDYIKKRKYEQK